MKRFDVEHEREREYEIRKRTGEMIEITFQVTDECNLRCTYCYETNKKNKKMTKEMAFEFIDKFFPIDDEHYFNGYFLGDTNKKFFVLNFFGGECLLEIDLINEIIEYFEKKCKENLELYQERLDCYQIIIQSNGVLLRTPKVVEFLDKYENKFVHWGDVVRQRKLRTFITVDGCQEFHDKCRVFKDTGKGSWQIVHDNIKWYIDRYGHEPETKGTITHDTLPLLYKSYLAYKEMGFHNIKITLINKPNEFTEEDKKIAREQYTKIAKDLLSYPNEDYHFVLFDFDKEMMESDTCGIGNCGTNGGGIAIDYSGNLFCCFHFTSASIPEWLRPLYNIGTLKDGITRLDRIEEIRKAFDINKHGSDKCFTCESFNLCTFCPAENYTFTGNIENDGHYDCEINKIQNAIGLYYKYKRSIIYGN